MATFADPVIMLFIGGFILAIAATKTGLDAQLAKVLLKPFGSKSVNVLLGFILITGVFSMFVSNTATAAMMLTFLTPVFKQLPPEGKGRIALTLSIPVAANLGGMATPIGTPPNAIALKYLNDPAGLNLNLGFGEWVLFMLPLVIVLLFIGWILLRTIFPFSQKTINLEIEGGMKKGFQTWVVIVTFIVTVLLWMTDKLTGINSYTVALIPFVVFALTGVINKYDLEEINWSVIWMVAGGFALGYGLNASGLAANAVESIPFGTWSPFVILLVSGIICYLLSSPADAYPGRGMLGHGRQAFGYRRHTHRAHRYCRGSIERHGAPHLHAAERTGFLHQSGKAERHGENWYHHGCHFHGVRLWPPLPAWRDALHLKNLTYIQKGLPHKGAVPFIFVLYTSPPPS